MSANSDKPFVVDDRRKQGYFTIDNVLLDVYGKQIGPHGIAVYAALARFANREQECWPSLATIGDRTGMSRRQVGREIAKLERLKIISITPQFDTATKTHKSNVYALLNIIGGMDSVTIPPMDSVTTGIDSVAHKQSSLKKNTRHSNNKKEEEEPQKYSDFTTHPTYIDDPE